MTNIRFLTFAGVLIAGMVICEFALSAKARSDRKHPTENVRTEARATAWNAFHPLTKAAGSLNIDPAFQDVRVETELITITTTGFEPAELTRPAGKFLLDVDNRSEIEEVELRLDRQDGGREKSARVRSTAPEWRGALDLRPGVYILSEANHRTWICRITITAD